MNFLIIKPTRRTNFPNLFCQEILHVSGSSSAHHQELFTVHSALVYVIKLAWHISVPNVQWKIPDDGQRNCPKHVVFIIKKFVTIDGHMNVNKRHSWMNVSGTMDHSPGLATYYPEPEHTWFSFTRSRQITR